MNEALAPADYALISRERTQALELLLHLITNSNQTLVICGPKGIGKTTLINAFAERKKNIWHYCSLSADIDLNFEKVLEHIAGVTGTDKNQPLQAVSVSTPQINKLILIVDDAGRLAPGVLAHIIEYALDNPVLRVVFALTPDELFIKNRTDRIIDDCYFIEIPPLTEKQCGDFLHYLATKPWANISVSTITDHIAGNLYRDTQGIPAHILEQLPDLAIVKNRDYALWYLIAAVVVLVAIALGVQWLSVSGYL